MTSTDGARDFDFLGTSVCKSFFGGAGSFDEIVFPTKGFSGSTLRLFDPERREWSIYWANSRDGRLQVPPVVGRFVDGRGEFTSEEAFEGRPILVRYLWLGITPTSARWEQAFSADGGQTAPAGTDLFIDPMGTAEALNAPRAMGTPAGDFMLRALVTVEFAASYDAGVLLLYAHEREWAKLCLELSPQGVPTIVSVVTRGASDDCNSFTVDGSRVWLRVSRLGPAFAFHACTDGTTWRLVRYFALDGAREAEVGFLAQSPTGAGCAARFDEIAFVPERLADLRCGG